MIDYDIACLLCEILEETDRYDKIKVELDPASKTLTMTYEDLDEEWFRGMQELLAVLR